MLTMRREVFEGSHFLVLTPDDPAFPPVAIECTGPKPCAMLGRLIMLNSRNVHYDDPDREKYMGKGDAKAILGD